MPPEDSVTPPDPTPRRGQSASLTFIVTEDDTAAALGSGDLAVLATPRLLAWCEAAACAAVEGLAAGSTSVGTRVTIDHVAPSPVGAQVEVMATVRHVDGRLLKFEVVAAQVDGGVLAHGEVTRVVVERERFMARVTA